MRQINLCVCRSGILTNECDSFILLLMPLVFGGESMPRQGLGKERVVQEAAALIEEKGLDDFSMGGAGKAAECKNSFPV